MKKDRWGVVRATKTGRMDKRTNLTKAFRDQGERSFDKKNAIVYNREKKESILGKDQTS